MAFDPAHVGEHDIFRFLAVTQRKPVHPDQTLVADAGQAPEKSAVYAGLKGAEPTAAKKEAETYISTAKILDDIAAVEKTIVAAKQNKNGIEDWFSQGGNRQIDEGLKTRLRDAVLALSVLRRGGSFEPQLRRVARALRFIALCEHYQPKAFYAPTALALEKLVSQVPIKLPTSIIRFDPDPLAIRIPDSVKSAFVRQIHVRVDEVVKQDETLVTIDDNGAEAIVRSPRDAVVKAVLVEPGMGPLRAGGLLMRLGIAPREKPAVADREKPPEATRPTPADIRRALDELDTAFGHHISQTDGAPRETPMETTPSVFGRALTFLVGQTAKDQASTAQPVRVTDIEDLSEPTKSVLKAVKVGTASVPEVRAALTSKLTPPAKATILPAQPTHFLVAGVAVPNIAKPSFGKWWQHLGGKLPPGGGDAAPTPPVSDNNLLPGMPAPARVDPIVQAGETMVVRKQLVGYELGEFSFVENVFAGETRGRTHRKRRLTEEEVRRLTVVEDQTEQHLQQTQRDELQSEMEKVSQTEMQFEAGAKLQGKYGPSITFQAEASAGVRSSVQTSTRAAANHVRETVSRSVAKVARRKEEELRRRIVTEIEETNSHEFSNKGSKHLRGVYRWLGKISKGQVYNIGFRHTVEFFIPEPAVNFLRLVAEGRVKAADLPRKPDVPPLGPDAEEWDLYWSDLGVEYEATVPPPPKQSETVVVAANATPGEIYGYSTTLTIPDGFEARFGRVKASKSKTDDDWWLHCWLGTKYFQYERSNFHWEYGSHLGRQRSQISFACLARYTRGVAIVAEVDCLVTEERLKEWRADAYNAVMLGYQTQLARWEEKMNEINEKAKEDRNREMDLPNPDVAERMVREELQRAFVSLLLNKNLGGLDAFVTSTGDTASWQYDWKKAAAVIPQIAFLQQAFEWHNMNAFFYPYFYGRPSRWAAALQLTKTADPAFAEFLTAGAARVQVPIRPEMADLVLRFLDQHQWPNDSAQDGQVLEDVNGVPLLQEMMESMDYPDDAIPVGDSWEFTIPTDLVILQDGNDVPFRDPLQATSTGSTTLKVNDEGAKAV